MSEALPLDNGELAVRVARELGVHNCRNASVTAIGDVVEVTVRFHRTNVPHFCNRMAHWDGMTPSPHPDSRAWTRKKGKG